MFPTRVRRSLRTAGSLAGFLLCLLVLVSMIGLMIQGGPTPDQPRPAMPERLAGRASAVEGGEAHIGGGAGSAADAAAVRRITREQEEWDRKYDKQYPPIIIAAFVMTIVLSLVSAFCLRRGERIRRKALALWAREQIPEFHFSGQQVRFKPEDDDGLGWRKLINQLSGSFRDIPVNVYDVESAVVRGMHTVYSSWVVTDLPVAIDTPVYVIPKLPAFKGAFKGNDTLEVLTESHEFNERFVVTSRNRRLALELVNPRFMAAMLELEPCAVTWLEGAMGCQWRTPQPSTTTGSAARFMRYAKGIVDRRFEPANFRRAIHVTVELASTCPAHMSGRPSPSGVAATESIMPEV